MKQAAVILAPGFEEGGALTIADILRRAEMECDLVGFSETVTGAHEIEVQCDRLLETLDPENPEYEMIILPGGMPGATHLRDSDRLMEILRGMDRAGKFVTAMCAAPIALERAGLLEGKNFTAYVGYDKKIQAGNFRTDIVARDGNLITSQGPATPYPFAYKIAEVLGKDVSELREKMLYNFAGGK